MLDLKKDIRKETDEKLEELRAQLQSDLAAARNKEEASAILKANEIASKRLEEQIAGSRAQKEQELMQRLAARRSARQDQSEARYSEGVETL